MTLDFIDHINDYGDNVVRLYDFDKAESVLFRDAILQTVIREQQELHLSNLDFITLRNCRLVLRLAEEDQGIVTENSIDFYCDMTQGGYEQMLLLLEPFCHRETKGYQFLYDVDSLTDFLFSPGGTW